MSQFVSIPDGALVGKYPPSPFPYLVDKEFWWGGATDSQEGRREAHETAVAGLLRSISMAYKIAYEFFALDSEPWKEGMRVWATMSMKILKIIPDVYFPRWRNASRAIVACALDCNAYIASKADLWPAYFATEVDYCRKILATNYSSFALPATFPFTTKEGKTFSDNIKWGNWVLPAMNACARCDVAIDTANAKQTICFIAYGVDKCGACNRKKRACVRIFFTSRVVLC